MPESRPSAVRALTWPEQLEPLADQPADLVEHLGQVAAGRPLDDHRDHEEPDVHDRDPVGHVAQRQLDRDAQVLLLEDAVELVGDRAFHLLGHQVQARGQAVAGPQGPADQLDGLGHRLDELVDPLLLPLEQPEEGQRAQEDRGQRARRRAGAGRTSPRTHAQRRASPATMAMNELKVRLTSACS